MTTFENIFRLAAALGASEVDVTLGETRARMTFPAAPRTEVFFEEEAPEETREETPEQVKERRARERVTPEGYDPDVAFPGATS